MGAGVFKVDFLQEEGLEPGPLGPSFPFFSTLVGGRGEEKGEQMRECQKRGTA